jgi:transcriptional regulator with XRE-family HTH domain
MSAEASLSPSERALLSWRNPESRQRRLASVQSARTWRQAQTAIFAANLRKRLQELEMSQSDLARAIWNETVIDKNGYPHPRNKDRVSAWVNRRGLPDDNNLFAIAAALETTPEALLGNPALPEAAWTASMRREAQHKLFAVNLRQRLRELNLSQSDLARAIWKEEEVDARGHPRAKGRASVSLYCTGRNLPSSDTLLRIAEILKTTPEALLGNSTLPPETAPPTSVDDDRDRFEFRWNGDSVTLELRAAFPIAVGTELMTSIVKALEAKTVL